MLLATQHAILDHIVTCKQHTLVYRPQLVTLLGIQILEHSNKNFRSLHGIPLGNSTHCLRL